MLYEKKMLILSGDGKGVVLMEKSAGGVRFSLRTFDMPLCGELKAGIITRKRVAVRDLPQTPDPAMTFSLDIDDISDLHFAVFDKKLRLYGCVGKRMWEANVMDLLCKSDRRPPVSTERMPMAPLAPIAPPPRVLPMPDGTGIPQSQLKLYGDEALAESDFYTSLDLQSKMPVVDKFLDEPRVLDGLAPRIEPTSLSETGSEKADAVPVAHEAVTDAVYEQSDETVDMSEGESSETVESHEEDVPVEADTPAQPTAEATRQFASAAENTVKTAVSGGTNDGEAMRAVAATVTEDAAPWEMEARWLKKRSNRELVKKTGSTARPVNNRPTAVRHVRETAFIELARDDIEKLFRYGEKDEQLSELLPDLKWIKVDTDGNTISVGRTDGVLCYAVAGTYGKVSPLGSDSQWLPSDRKTPTGKGYWLIFQSLADGTIISNK